jgi:hypothetical protein
MLTVQNLSHKNARRNYKYNFMKFKMKKEQETYTFPGKEREAAVHDCLSFTIWKPQSWKSEKCSLNFIFQFIRAGQQHCASISESFARTLFYFYFINNVYSNNTQRGTTHIQKKYTREPQIHGYHWDST